VPEFRAKLTKLMEVTMSEERLKLLKELQAEWDEWQMKLALDRLFKNRKLKERRKGTK
jgi:hypothetical protein